MGDAVDSAARGVAGSDFVPPQPVIANAGLIAQTASAKNHRCIGRRGPIGSLVVMPRSVEPDRPKRVCPGKKFREVRDAALASLTGKPPPVAAAAQPIAAAPAVASAQFRIHNLRFQARRRFK